RMVMIPKLTAALLLTSALAACQGASLPRAPEVGARAPEYAAATLDGGQVTLADHEGEVVLLNVWATWCIPCQQETPALQRLHERFGEQGLRIVGVSVDARGEEASIRDFASSYGVTYDIWYDPAERVISTFRVIGVPNTFLIDREGVVRWKHIGPVLDDDAGLLSSI